MLAVELAGNPRVVLLDEPTRGLDYAAKAALSQIIADMAAEGRAVLIATHDTHLIQQARLPVFRLERGELRMAA